MQTLTPPSGRIWEGIGLKIYTALVLAAIKTSAKFQLSSFYPSFFGVNLNIAKTVAYCSRRVWSVAALSANICFVSTSSPARAVCRCIAAILIVA